MSLWKPFYHLCSCSVALVAREIRGNWARELREGRQWPIVAELFWAQLGQSRIEFYCSSLKKERDTF